MTRSGSGTAQRGGPVSATLSVIQCFEAPSPVRRLTSATACCPCPHRSNMELQSSAEAQCPRPRQPAAYPQSSAEASVRDSHLLTVTSKRPKPQVQRGGLHPRPLPAAQNPAQGDFHLRRGERELQVQRGGFLSATIRRERTSGPETSAGVQPAKRRGS